MVHKVLLADDSPTIHQIVVNALSDSDFQLFAVRDGQQAIEQMDKITPDIILAKAIMPKVDGYQLCEYVRKTPHLAHIPLILLVSRFQPYDQERDAKAGVSRMMFKPFLPEQLMRQMEQLLQEAPVAQAQSEPKAFDEGATVAISPADLRAHLQSLDHITRTQDEEIPSIDDFQLADEGFVEDDEPEVVEQAEAFSDDATLRVDEPLELSTEDLDDLELDDEEAVEDFDDAATLVAEPYEINADDLGDDSFESLELEDSSPDLESGLAFEDDETALPEAEFSNFEEESELFDEAPVAAEDELSLEDSGEQVALDDSGQLELVDDSLEELDLEDMVGEPEELEDLPPASVSVDDDTQPVDMDALSAGLSDFDEPLDNSADLELELDEEVDFDTAPGADEDVLGLNRPDSGEFESYSEGPDPSEDSSASMAAQGFMDDEEQLAEEPLIDALPEEEPSFADAVDEEFAALEDDPALSTVDEDLFADDEVDLEEPPPTAETERYDEAETDFAIDEDELDTEFAAIDETEDAADEVTDVFGDDDQLAATEVLDDLDLGEHEEMEEPTDDRAVDNLAADSGAETIRFEEPLIQPEEAAYFADTVRSDQPLVRTAPPEAPPARVEVEAPATAVALALDEAQMNRLADMVVQRLVERLGSGDVRDIVWQVVPELAEAMIKKRIYQLEQSVEAE